MNKKSKKEKGSSKSVKEIPEEEIDLSEYEDAESEDKVDYDEYELPEDFISPEDQSDEDLSWFQRRKNAFTDMDNYQRLYWIKILSGVITGMILGVVGAQTAWWLILLVGLYAILAGGGLLLFKLDWNWKEILFSGFFPYLALFTLFWTLMFTSLHGPSMFDWTQMLVVTTTINQTTTTFVSIFTNTTTAAGFPILEIVLIATISLGLLQHLLRRRSKLD
ncbi:MAG: EMC6 family protein [Candidatus Heimdallarchaeota archaeon]